MLADRRDDLDDAGDLTSAAQVANLEPVPKRCAWAVDAYRSAVYMHAIPNPIWVPAPVTSAWDFLRLRISREGRPPPDVGIVSTVARGRKPRPTDMELGPWLV